MRVRNVKGFVLSDEETIINKGKDRNGDSEIFQSVFQNIEKWGKIQSGKDWRKSGFLTHSNIDIENRGGELVPQIIGSSPNQIICEEGSDFRVETCFLEDKSEKTMI